MGKGALFARRVSVMVGTAQERLCPPYDPFCISSLKR
ncbi:MAG: hypothetical protein QOH32_1500 [Bradyrhizobium sp.]|jgi:hypothetical protein|nr:hypothetical protein [Bradyrhizobium sp.]